MSYSIKEMFLLLDSSESISQKQVDLFGFSLEEDSPAPSQMVREYGQETIDFAAAFFSGGLGSFICTLPASARRLLELSVNAFDIFVFAWLSEEPIEKEIIKFGRTVIAAAGTGNDKHNRAAAEKAACNHGDENLRTVLAAASRAQHEIHRIMGLLRFSPNDDGVYIARCAPDHFILPALTGFFTSRFGKDTSWAIIDEKRSLVLSRRLDERAKVYKANDVSVKDGKESQWEDLWRHYHKTINNESRNTPNLQRQLMPKRYWKYLPEKSN